MSRYKSSHEGLRMSLVSPLHILSYFGKVQTVVFFAKLFSLLALSILMICIGTLLGLPTRQVRVSGILGTQRNCLKLSLGLTYLVPGTRQCINKNNNITNKNSSKSSSSSNNNYTLKPLFWP